MTFALSWPILDERLPARLLLCGGPAALERDASQKLWRNHSPTRQM
jgi:hypothetical protein